MRMRTAVVDGGDVPLDILHCSNRQLLATCQRQPVQVHSTQSQRVISWASTWARSVSSSGISITSSFSLPDEPSDCSAASSSSSCTRIVLTARIQALRLQHVQIRLEIARSSMGRIGHNAWPCLRMRPLRCRCRSLIIVRRRHVAMLRRQLVVRLLVVVRILIIDIVRAVVVVVGVLPRPDRCGQHRQPVRRERHKVLQQPRHRPNRFQWLSRPSVRVIPIGTDALVVHQRYPPVDAVLHQRVHDRTIDLTEELTSVLATLGQYDEPVVVEQIAIELVRRTVLLAGRRGGTLKTKKKSQTMTRWRADGVLKDVLPST
uniref:Uncharacterized protein n=1 Tax=Anopheles melas TaxID=34690 RepID=A0A182UJF9_9DIPT